MLRTLTRAVVLAVTLCVSLPPRLAAAEVGAARDESLPPPSASEAGWFAATVGIGQPWLKTTLGSDQPSADAEGSVGSAGNYRLLYERQLYRFIGLRGFMSATDWGTDHSEHGGDGDRALFDLGGAPVFSFAARPGRHGVSLFAFVPLSFTWSSAPARAPRQVVLERMDLGTGYRVGVGVGLLVRLSRSLGLLIELEGAAQHVNHSRRYTRVDGTGQDVVLPITYDLRWLGLELGLALFP